MANCSGLDNILMKKQENDSMNFINSHTNLIRCLAAVFIVGLLTTACDESIYRDRNNQYSASEDFSNTFNLDGQTTLRISGINGTIDIRGVSGASTVEVWGERIVESDSATDAERHLPGLLVLFSETSSEIIVRTDQPSNTEGRNYIVEYHCLIPDDMLVIGSNVNGFGDLSQLKTDISFVVANGFVSADSIAGDIDINVTNGNIVLFDTYGDVDADVTNGFILGTIVLPPAGSCDMSVTNGLITLSIPDSTSADLNAFVTNGSIEMRNLTFADVTSSNLQFSGRLGSGDGQIELRMTNGIITVTGH